MRWHAITGMQILTCDKRYVYICVPDIGDINPYSAGTDFRRQILTTKVHTRAERIKIFIMAVYPKHRYSNEAEWAD